MALTDLARVKRFLKIAGAEKDAILGDLISQVSAALESALDRRVEQAAYVDELHETFGGDDLLAVFNYPIIGDVTGINENGDALAAADFRVLDAAAGLIQRMGGEEAVPWPAGTVLVTYSGGYATVPADLAGAATAEVARAYTQTNEGGERLGLAAGGFPGQVDQQFLEWDWLPLTKEAIAVYGRRA